jgi:hypothetical protein
VLSPVVRSYAQPASDLSFLSPDSSVAAPRPSSDHPVGRCPRRCCHRCVLPTHREAWATVVLSAIVRMKTVACSSAAWLGWERWRWATEPLHSVDADADNGDDDDGNDDNDDDDDDEHGGDGVEKEATTSARLISIRTRDAAWRAMRGGGRGAWCIVVCFGTSRAVCRSRRADCAGQTLPDRLTADR